MGNNISHNNCGSVECCGEQTINGTTSKWEDIDISPIKPLSTAIQKRVGTPSPTPTRRTKDKKIIDSRARSTSNNSVANKSDIVLRYGSAKDKPRLMTNNLRAKEKEVFSMLDESVTFRTLESKSVKARFPDWSSSLPESEKVDLVNIQPGVNRKMMSVVESTRGIKSVFVDSDYGKPELYIVSETITTSKYSMERFFKSFGREWAAVEKPNFLAEYVNAKRCDETPANSSSDEVEIELAADEPELAQISLAIPIEPWSKEMSERTGNREPKLTAMTPVPFVPEFKPLNENYFPFQLPSDNLASQNSERTLPDEDELPLQPRFATEPEEDDLSPVSLSLPKEPWSNDMSERTGNREPKQTTMEPKPLILKPLETVDFTETSYKLPVEPWSNDMSERTGNREPKLTAVTPVPFVQPDPEEVHLPETSIKIPTEPWSNEMSERTGNREPKQTTMEPMPLLEAPSEDIDYTQTSCKLPVEPWSNDMSERTGNREPKLTAMTPVPFVEADPEEVDLPEAFLKVPIEPRLHNMSEQAGNREPKQTTMEPKPLIETPSEEIDFAQASIKIPVEPWSNDMSERTGNREPKLPPMTPIPFVEADPEEVHLPETPLKIPAELTSNEMSERTGNWEPKQTPMEPKPFIEKPSEEIDFTQASLKIPVEPWSNDMSERTGNREPKITPMTSLPFVEADPEEVYLHETSIKMPIEPSSNKMSETLGNWEPKQTPMEPKPLIEKPSEEIDYTQGSLKIPVEPWSNDMSERTGNREPKLTLMTSVPIAEADPEEVNLDETTMKIPTEPFSCEMSERLGNWEPKQTRMEPKPLIETPSEEIDYTQVSLKIPVEPWSNDMSERTGNREPKLTPVTPLPFVEADPEEIHLPESLIKIPTEPFSCEMSERLGNWEPKQTPMESKPFIEEPSEAINFTEAFLKNPIEPRLHTKSEIAANCEPLPTPMTPLPFVVADPAEVNLAETSIKIPTEPSSNKMSELMGNWEPKQTPMEPKPFIEKVSEAIDSTEELFKIPIEPLSNDVFERIDNQKPEQTPMEQLPFTADPPSELELPENSSEMPSEPFSNKMSEVLGNWEPKQTQIEPKPFIETVSEAIDCTEACLKVPVEPDSYDISERNGNREPQQASKEPKPFVEAPPEEIDLSEGSMKISSEPQSTEVTEQIENPEPVQTALTRVPVAMDPPAEKELPEDSIEMPNYPESNDLSERNNRPPNDKHVVPSCPLPVPEPKFFEHSEAGLDQAYEPVSNETSERIGNREPKSDYLPESFAQDPPEENDLSEVSLEPQNDPGSDWINEYRNNLPPKHPDLLPLIPEPEKELEEPSLFLSFFEQAEETLSNMLSEEVGQRIPNQESLPNQPAVKDPEESIPLEKSMSKANEPIDEEICLLQPKAERKMRPFTPDVPLEEPTLIEKFFEQAEEPLSNLLSEEVGQRSPSEDTMPAQPITRDPEEVDSSEKSLKQPSESFDDEQTLLQPAVDRKPKPFAPDVVLDEPELVFYSLLTISPEPSSKVQNELKFLPPKRERMPRIKSEDIENFDHSEQSLTPSQEPFSHMQNQTNAHFISDRTPQKPKVQFEPQNPTNFEGKLNPAVEPSARSAFEILVSAPNSDTMPKKPIPPKAPRQLVMSEVSIKIPRENVTVERSASPKPDRQPRKLQLPPTPPPKVFAYRAPAELLMNEATIKSRLEPHSFLNVELNDSRPPNSDRYPNRLQENPEFDNEDALSDHSVCSEDLFKEGTDDIIFEGELFKFKPGLSSNFQSRFVQVSERAFRYFKNKLSSQTGNPIVAFRRNIIKEAIPISVPKNSYIKKGSKIYFDKLENHLFDGMFEIKLKDHYEFNYGYRDIERREMADKLRSKIQSNLGIKSKESALSRFSKMAYGMNKSPRYSDFQTATPKSGSSNNDPLEAILKLNTSQISDKSRKNTSHFITKNRSTERVDSKSRSVSGNRETLITKSHAMPLRAHRDKIQSGLDSEVMEKDFGKDDKNGLESMTWQNREKDWYNAERRFIFACPDTNLKAQWIKKIVLSNIKMSIKSELRKSLKSRLTTESNVTSKKTVKTKKSSNKKSSQKSEQKPKVSAQKVASQMGDVYYFSEAFPVDQLLPSPHKATYLGSVILPETASLFSSVVTSSSKKTVKTSKSNRKKVNRSDKSPIIERTNTGYSELVTQYKKIKQEMVGNLANYKSTAESDHEQMRMPRK